MLTKDFTKNITAILQPDFSTIKQVKSLFDEHNQKKLYIEGQDEDQLWAQIQIAINDLMKKSAKEVRYVEERAAKLADQVMEGEEQATRSNQGGDDDQDAEDEKEDLEVGEEDEHQSGESEIQDGSDGEVEDGDGDAEWEDESREKNIKQEEVKKGKKRKDKQGKDNFDDFDAFEKYMDGLDQGKIDVEEDGEGDEEEEDEEDGQADGDVGEEDEEEDPDEEGQNREDEGSEHGEDSVFDEMREDAMNDQEQQISELEHKLMAPKDWQFKGEVSARQRPLNSLVEQDLDFQVNRQRIQQALPEQTHQLEEIIKQRVKDELYDDRQKVQLNLSSAQPEKKNEVDTNKSQFGLAEIYERQFKQALGLPTNTTEQKLKQEVYQIFRELSYKLDSLSNLQFEPRGHVRSAEVKVDALQKEEKVPLTLRGNVEDKSQKRPERILHSKEEANPEENQRRHRQMKQRKRNKLRDQKRKGMIRKIETKGETKFMYNEAKKGQKRLGELSSQIKNRESVKFDKSSRFFKNLEGSKTRENGASKTIRKQK